jgi:hypothetical protein
MMADAHYKHELCCVCPNAERLKTLGRPDKRVLTADGLLMLAWESPEYDDFQDLKDDCVTPIKAHNFEYEWATFRHRNAMHYYSYVNGVPYHGDDDNTGVLFVDPTVVPPE